MVKKSLLIVACLLSLTLVALILATNIAEAQSALVDTDTASWARVLNESVYLYKSANINQPLFLLEKSYYVQIIQEMDNMYQVAVIPNDTDFVYIVGYVRQNDVSLCSTPPVAPYYPAVKVTVTVDSTIMKKFDESTSAPAWAVFNAEQMRYYGKRVISGATWYYVWYADQFGYVEASAVSPPQVALHPTPLPQAPASTTPTTPSDDPTDNTPKDGTLPASEILLIVFIVVLAVGLMLALFLPGNLKKKSNVFEQDI